MELVLHAAHDVQIRHAGFDHHHVGAFGDVERHFAQRFVGVRRVHLVDLLVALAEVRRRADGVAERAVEGTRVLGAVGHDAGVDQALRFERRTDRADAPVHHVAGCDDVDTGLRLHQRLLRQHGHGLVVEDVAVLVRIRIGQAVLAMCREGIERHVGHQAELGETLLQRAHHRRHQAFRVQGFTAVGGLAVRLDDGEQGHHRNPEPYTFFGHRQQPVQAQALHAGHGLHVLCDAAAGQHEDGQDQVGCGELVFADQGTREGITAQTPRSAGGVGRRCVHRTRKVMRPAAKAPRSGVSCRMVHCLDPLSKAVAKCNASARVVGE